MSVLIANYIFSLSILLAIAIPTAFQIRCGALSLAHTAFFGVGAYFSSYIWRYWFPGEFVTGLTFIAAFIGAIITGGIFGAIVGKITNKVAGDALLVITLLIVEIVRRIGEVSSCFAGTSGVVISRFTNITPVERSWILTFIAIFWALGSGMVIWRLNRSGILGMADYTRHDREVARLLGIPTHQIFNFAFIWSGIVSAGSGTLHASFYGFVSPAEFSVWHAIVVFVMALAGWKYGLKGIIISTSVLYAIPKIFELVGVRIKIGFGNLDTVTLSELWPLTFAILLALLSFVRIAQKDEK